MSQKTQKSMNLEESLKTLEDIVQTMENESLDLEKSIELFETGMRLTKNCHQMLTQAEQKVKQITETDEAYKLTDYITEDE
jgi:exodeoxyribonuclease VII small subunit